MTKRDNEANAHAQIEQADDLQSGATRRDFLKSSAVAAAGGLATAGASATAASAAGSDTTNPYGDRPGGGASLPDYYKP